MAKIRAFPVPPKTFGTLDIAVVVAFVAHHDRRGRRVNGVELSERQAQKLLAVASRSTMHKRLRSSQSLGLLEVVERSRTGVLGQTTGNSYRLGPIAKRERRRWVSLGETLFAAGGMFKALEARGALLYDALGRDGRWLTYSLAASCSGVPVSPEEVFAAARGLLRSEKLVLSHLERLVDLGLATRVVSKPTERPRYIAHGLATLGIVAAEQGWESRYQRLERHISNEQLGLTSITAQIRELPCCYCGREGPSDTIEHVPPQHWTGTKKAGLLLPACSDCNQPDGPKIGKVPRLCIGRPAPRLVLPRHDWETLTSLDDLTILKSLEPAFVSLIREYRDSMKTDNPERALEAAESLAPIAEAVRQEFLEIVDAESGEVRSVEVSGNFAVWLAYAVTVTVPRAAILDGFVDDP